MKGLKSSSEMTGCLSTKTVIRRLPSKGFNGVNREILHQTRGVALEDYRGGIQSATLFAEVLSRRLL